MTLSGHGRRAIRALTPLFLLGAAPTTEPAKMRAWIALEADADGSQHFMAYVQTDRPFSGRFELIGERRGGGGTSRVTQGGSIQAAAGQTVRLSQLAFGNLAAIPHYAVQLRVFAGENLVTSSQLVK